MSNPTLRAVLRLIAFSSIGATVGGIALFGMQVALSREPDTHTHFIVAAALGVPAGAILTTFALRPFHVNWRKSLLSVLLTVATCILGVIVGRMLLGRSGSASLALYPVLVGASASCGYLAGCLPSLQHDA